MPSQRDFDPVANEREAPTGLAHRKVGDPAAQDGIDALHHPPDRLGLMPTEDVPERPQFAVQCTSVGNLDRVAQNRRFEAESENAEAMQAMLDAAEADGTRVRPEYGSVWISMNGPDQASARIHTTIAVPGGTTESTGLPDTPAIGHPGPVVALGQSFDFGTLIPRVSNHPTHTTTNHSPPNYRPSHPTHCTAPSSLDTG